MFVIFVEGADNEIDYQEVYSLVTSEHDLDRDIEALESFGVSYAWRQII